MRSSITAMAVAFALALAGVSDAFFGNLGGYGGSGYGSDGCGGGCGGNWGNDRGCANPYAGYGDYTNCRYAEGLWAGFCAPRAGNRTCGLSGCGARQDCCGAGGAWWYGGNQQPCEIPRLSGQSGFGGLGCSGGLGGLGGLGGSGGSGGRCGSANRGCGSATGCGAGCGGGFTGFSGCRGFESLFQRLRSQMACQSWVGGGPLDRYGVSDGFSCSGLDFGILSKWGSAPTAAAAAPVGATPVDAGYVDDGQPTETISPVESFDEGRDWDYTQGESTDESNPLDKGLDLDAASDGSGGR